MQQQSQQGGQSRLITFAAAAAVVAALYLARDLLIPLALATLLSFLLSPLAERLERWGLGRLVSVFAVSIIALAPLVLIGWLIVLQFLEVAALLPLYRANIEQRFQGIVEPANAWLDRLTGAVRELGLGAPEPPEPDPSEPDQPVPVRVVEPPPGPAAVARAIFGPLIRPLAMIGIVAVFVLFMLAQREDLRDRMIRLVSQDRLTVTTQAMTEIAERVSRYLRMQLLLNSVFGVLAATGLLLIGVPNALLWGFLSIALRFIPYAGPVLSAGLPLGMALAVSDGWTMPLLTLGLYVVLESVSSYFFEPWLYGLTTGISSISLLVAAVFWTWLWGVPGLLLSTPMTVCLVVAGRYVPQLDFLHVLLGSEPAMEPRARLYQRLLARDADEAADVAGEYLQAHGLVETFDELLIPALRAADQDLEDGALDERRQAAVHWAVQRLVEMLPARAAEFAAARTPTAPGHPRGNGSETATPATVPPPKPLPPLAGTRVLCVPARDESDVLAGRMLEALLRPMGVHVHVVPLEDLGVDLAAIVERSRPQVICISAVPPFAATQARLRLRQLRLRAPAVPTAIGLWDVTVETARSTERLRSAGADSVVFSLAEAMDRVQAMLRAQVAATGRPPDSGEAGPGGG